jgi:hemerythrin-like domain-containing protein
MAPESGFTRRGVLKGALAACPPLLVGASPALGRVPQGQTQPAGEIEVSTVEDLMREHGVLRRVLLIYGEAMRRIEGKMDLPADAVAGGAGLVRRFVEDYHEKLEEEYLFPRFRKAGTLVDLVNVLEEQHKRGRALTADIQKLATAAGAPTAADRAKLRERLQLFVRMYAPHAAREDTVLFPAFKKLVSPKEYDALGDEFEAKEQQLFGEGGFEKNVQEVAALEKRIGVYELAQFTPKA